MSENLFVQGPTYAHRILEATDRFRHRSALKWKEKGRWREMTFHTMEQKLLEGAHVLKQKGVQKGDRVAIWLETSLPWLLADFAVQVLGGVTTPVYHSIPQEQALQIIQNSEAKILLTSPDRKNALAKEKILKSCTVMDISELFFNGKDLNASQKKLLKNISVSPEDLSATIYTSGTTGEPKGVMLTHKNITESLDRTTPCFVGPERLSAFLHLPLAHIMARNVLIPVMLLSGNRIIIAEPDRNQFLSNMQETRPSALMTVPYLLDKFTSTAKAKMDSQSPWISALFHKAFSLNRLKRVPSYTRARPAPRPLLNWKTKLLDFLVLRKIRQALGGNLRYIIIGGASSNPESVAFFWTAGIPVYEGYGATEVTGAATFNWHENVKLGTVGKPPPGVEVKIAEDGEVLIRGPIVMPGYWKRPEATKEVLDEEGYYHTGDIGEVDSDGHLKILDRKKEIYALATGKKVAPQKVESALKTCDLILQAFAIGDRRKFMTALIVPDLVKTQKKLGLSAPPSLTEPRVQKFFQKEVDECMDKAGLADFERIKHIQLIGEPFTPENGLLTPTLKLRRRQILEKYSALIEGLYE